MIRIRTSGGVRGGKGDLPLYSIPETSSGWFGREGLRIRAVFQFTESQFDCYVEQLGDGKVWRPISFLHYAPPGADSSTASAHDWHQLKGCFRSRL